MVFVAFSVIGCECVSTVKGFFICELEADSNLSCYIYIYPVSGRCDGTPICCCAAWYKLVKQQLCIKVEGRDAYIPPSFM